MYFTLTYIDAAWFVTLSPNNWSIFQLIASLPVLNVFGSRVFLILPFESYVWSAPQTRMLAWGKGRTTTPRTWLRSPLLLGPNTEKVQEAPPTSPNYSCSWPKSAWWDANCSSNWRPARARRIRKEEDEEEEGTFKQLWSQSARSLGM